MSSCSEAFVTLRPCAIIVVGVAGSMPVHGIGTAMFTVSIGDRDVILTVFNCLFCHGEDEGFNLLSVSQILRTKTNSIQFCEGNLKSPSRLGTWTRKLLWLGARSLSTVEYDNNLKEFYIIQLK